MNEIFLKHPELIPHNKRNPSLNRSTSMLRQTIRTIETSHKLDPEAHKLRDSGKNAQMRIVIFILNLKALLASTFLNLSKKLLFWGNK